MEAAIIGAMVVVAIWVNRRPPTPDVFDRALGEVE